MFRLFGFRLDKEKIYLLQQVEQARCDVDQEIKLKMDVEKRFKDLELQVLRMIFKLFV